METKQFGLAATGTRSKILHTADGKTIHDSVVVYNRTKAPLTVSLDVVGVTRKADGSYDLGASGAGLAGRVKLATRSVALAPNAQQVVMLTIDEPGSLTSAAYAAVTAVAGGTPSTGVAVTERLAVLVGLTPSASGSSSGSGSTHTRTIAVVVATVLLLALLAILVAALVLRRRRQTPVAG